MRTHGFVVPVRTCRILALLVSVAAVPAPAVAETTTPASGGTQVTSAAPATAHVRIPRIDEPLVLDDFTSMNPPRKWAGRLATVTGFIQRRPDDGRPATQATTAYLAFDAKGLYVVFVAHDSSPSQVRARLSRREAISEEEDRVAVYIDTFEDARRAYRFGANPLGVQEDALYSEDADADDAAFDTVWNARGTLTAGGYVVLMHIPFKSLRFPVGTEQTWRLALWRWLGRRAEGSWWPRVTSHTRGILRQAASADGLRDVSPGRNVQLTPFMTGSTFVVPDGTSAPREIRSSDLRAGFDAKTVLRDSLVLDLTVNPDFSQIESDEPQVATNARYELFYPERRPFFTENASYFDVPMIVPRQRLVFTRRAVDPGVGARLTGNLGAYSIGALVVNDRAAGRLLPPDHEAHGRDAIFDVFRVTRDVGRGSNVGGSYIERQFAGSFSRVLDLDTTLSFASTWKATVTGAYNWRRSLDGHVASGGDVDATLTRVGRSFGYIGYYVDRAPGFRPETSFFGHSDWREIGQTVSYQWWPLGSPVTRVYSEVYAARNTHQNGDLSWHGVSPRVTVDLAHTTSVTAYNWVWQDAFGPRDFKTLTTVGKLPVTGAYGLTLSSARRVASVYAELEWGERPNYVPAPGRVPELTSYRYASIRAAGYPLRNVSLDMAGLFDSSVSRAARANIEDSATARARVNWQITRELSVRVIGQYDRVRVNPALTATAPAHRVTGDVLLTYLVQPGTAVFVGYDRSVFDLFTVNDTPGGVTRRFPASESRQAFVKVSYLVRF